MKGLVITYFLFFLGFYGFISPGNTQTLSRFNVPFIIEGKELGNPLTGGLQSPQISNVDLNLDGILDIVVFDKVGDVLLPYINNGNTSGLIFEFSPEYIDIFPDPKIWMLLKDYNNDGINDIFKCPSVPGIPGIEVWKGVVENDLLRYELVQMVNRDFDILYVPIGNNVTQIYVSIIDVPAIEDVDGDGDLDVLSFEPGGTKVTFYKNIAVENELGLDSLSFILEDNCYGKFQESGFSSALSLSDDPNICASLLQDPSIEIRHSGSTITVLDENGDGLSDLLLGDLSTPNLVMVINGGSQEKAWFTGQQIDFPNYSVPVDINVFVASYYIDINNDQKRDLVVTSNEPNALQNEDHVWFFSNGGEDDNPSFSLVQKNFLIEDMMHFGTTSNPCFSDFNQDGLMDILVGTQGIISREGNFKSKILAFENVGTSRDPKFELIDGDYLNFSSFASSSTGFAPTTGDLDGDGDDDLIIGDGQGFLYYLENLAENGQTYDFKDPIYPFQNLQVGQQVRPCIFDFNNDGLGDLLIGERNFNLLDEQIGSLNYLQNTGTNGDPKFSVNDLTGNNPVFGQINTKQPGFINNYSAPSVVATEDDILIFTGSESGIISVYDSIQNNLGGKFRKQIADLGIREGVRTTPDFADINNDGYLEALVGNLRGGLALYHTGVKISDISTAVTEERIDLQIQVFPNPTNSNMSISGLDKNEQYKVSVLSLNGKILLNSQVSSDLTSIDISGLDDGMYFLFIQGKKQKGITRFVKIR